MKVKLESEELRPAHGQSAHKPSRRVGSACEGMSKGAGVSALPSPWVSCFQALLLLSVTHRGDEYVWCCLSSQLVGRGGRNSPLARELHSHLSQETVLGLLLLVPFLPS